MPIAHANYVCQHPVIVSVFVLFLVVHRCLLFIGAQNQGDLPHIEFVQRRHSAEVFDRRMLVPGF